MGRNKLNFDISEPVVLYDLAIEDLEERKSKAKRFDSIAKCARYLCVPHRTVRSAIGVGKRVFSDAYNKSYAVRFNKEN